MTPITKGAALRRAVVYARGMSHTISPEDVLLAFAFGQGCAREDASAAIGDHAESLAGALDASVRESGEAQIEVEGQGLFLAMGSVGVDPMTGEPADPGARVIYFPNATASLEARRKAQGPRPFPYLGHGVAYSRKALELAIGFEQAPTDAVKRAFESSIPEPLGIVFAWGQKGAHFGSDDTYEMGVRMAAAAARGEALDFATMSLEDLEALEPTLEDWQEYERILEDWLRRVHAAAPLTFVFKPTSPEMGEDFSDWHRDSAAKWKELGPVFDESLPIDIAAWVFDTGAGFTG